jgi:PAS domain S-box-containing protein
MPKRPVWTSVPAAGDLAAERLAAERLAAENSQALLHLFDAPPNAVLERFIRLACQVMRAPVALVTLLGPDGLSVGACCGLEEPGNDPAFCVRTLQGDAALIVLDALLDSRFSNEPMVRAINGVRFYAGMPLIAATGERLGTLCVIDFEPRLGLEPAQLEAFKDLAAVTVDAFGLRRVVQVARASELHEHEIALRQQALLGAIPDLVFRLARDGTYLEVHGGRELMIVPPEEFIGLRLDQVMPPALACDAMAALTQALETGLTQTFEYALPINGVLHSFEARLSKSLEDEVVALIRDRTREQRALEALAAERDFSMQVMEAMGQGLAVVDADRCFEYINPALARMMGWQQYEMIGQHALTSSDQHSEVRNAAWMAAQNGQVGVHEAQLVRPDGQELHVLMTAVPRFKDDRFLGTVSVITDLTERYRLEREIQRERDFIAAVTDAANTLIVVVDHHGIVVQFNQAASALSGFELSELSERPFWETLMVEPHLDQVFAVFDQVSDSNASIEIEIPMVSKSGEYLEIVWSVAPLRDTSGTVTHFVGKGVNISERRAAEARADAALKDAQRANRLKSEFLANVSHELRTPLHALVGFVDLLADAQTGVLNDEQLDCVNEIGAASDHLLSLINDLLDLSKLESGSTNFLKERLHLETLLESSLSLVRHRAEAQNIALALSVAPELQTIQAGSRQFKQVMLNLLSNAVQFTPEHGTIRIEAKSGTDLFAGTLEVTVHDSGVGIAKEDLERIFEPFSQVTSALEGHKGFGLGLTLTKRLVELHGGSLTVNSEPGAGSSFTVRLPA